MARVEAGEMSHLALDDMLARCRAGDESAWRQLVSAHAGLVYAVARRAGAPDDVCDDVAQIVFATLSRKLGSIREPEALAGWLATSTRREAWRALRRRGQTGSGDDAGARGDVRAIEADADRLLRHHELRRALDELGGRCRDLLTLLFLRAPATEYEQISDALGMPIGSIGPTRRRCLEKLAGILDGGAHGLDRGGTRGDHGPARV